MKISQEHHYTETTEKAKGLKTQPKAILKSIYHIITAPYFTQRGRPELVRAKGLWVNQDPDLPEEEVPVWAPDQDWDRGPDWAERLAAHRESRQNERGYGGLDEGCLSS